MLKFLIIVNMDRDYPSGEGVVTVRRNVESVGILIFISFRLDFKSNVCLFVIFSIDRLSSRVNVMYVIPLSHKVITNL
mgnify:CR=1 FL=1